MKSHCKRGHEFTPENTFLRENRSNSRECKQCKVDRAAEAHQSNLEQNRKKLNEKNKINRKSEKTFPSFSPEKQREYKLKSTYNISINQYLEMSSNQGSRCAICPNTDSGYSNNSFAVDHDHKCCPGEKSCGRCVRGLLCRNCNTGLGCFQDNQDYLRSAARYLNG